MHYKAQRNFFILLLAILCLLPLAAIGAGGQLGHLQLLGIPQYLRFGNATTGTSEIDPGDNGTYQYLLPNLSGTFAMTSNLGTYAPIDSPTFTTSVALPSTWSVNGTTITATPTELNYVHNVTSALQTQLNALAPLASPTFTGTVALPTAWSVNATTVTATGAELNYVHNVTSAVQTQLNAKAPSTGVVSFGIAIDGGGSPITTGTKGFTVLPYAGTITNWYVIGDQSGSCVIDIDRNGTSIIGAGNKPTLSSAQRANAAVASWTSTAIAANDEFEFECDSIATCTRINLIVYVTRTY